MDSRQVKGEERVSARVWCDTRQAEQEEHEHRGEEQLSARARARDAEAGLGPPCGREFVGRPSDRRAAV